ncbi:tetratricopeptide repeat protein [Paracidovorax avenae]|uniref:tetratricopeptide repeat protein n=1 Tax=Paracidovorax avenae TaxID=80867 RepID=UPI000D721555|nr:NB-ARC domain-containing protein [Paracidovorax avenae]
MTQMVAARNTCFAIVSAIEDDFRSSIQSIAQVHLLTSDMFPSDIRENAAKRRATDLRTSDASISIPDADLLPYIDFTDISKILRSKISPVLLIEREWIIEVADLLTQLAPIRNRVCHTRPLEPDDLAKLVEFARYLQQARNSFLFPAVSSTLARLEAEPTYVLTLQIPQFWSDGRTKIHNNLPVAEFDETGFLGRAGDRSQVLKLLRSHYPVITIVGEGGIGKTALALRCLYDIVDDPHCEFDAVVWISLKTSALTQAGVKALSGAVTETLGIFSEIANQLGTPKTSVPKTESELIQELSEYLDLYKILIAIDNLETLSTGSLRELLLRVPTHSKILLTSRVGVGEFEARYPLQALDEKTSVALFRAYSKVLGSPNLGRLDDGNIRGYTRQLFNNPLLIKWFVAAIGLGAQPSALLNLDRAEFSVALSFCFDNLFERFGERERLVINCLSCARKPLTSAELRFLTPELTDLDTEIALSALHNSSLVSRSKSGQDDFEYSLSESAKKFIATKAAPSAELFKMIQSRLRELRTILTGESILEARYEYDPYFVRVGSGRDERIAATYLRRALDNLHHGDIEGARSVVQDARRLAPHSAEGWRISALIEERSQEFYRASECYEQAIQLDSNSKICRYCYAQFLANDIEDLDGALEQFDAALQLAPSAPPPLQGKALTLLRLGRLDEAAKIHDSLLGTLHTRERRWRLTGADQAADCYRRICFRAWEKKEFNDARIAAKRALQIILDSALRGDIDEKLLRRAARVINEALSRRELVQQNDFVEWVLVNAEKIHDLAGGASIPVVIEASWAFKNTDLSEISKKRLQALDRYTYQCQQRFPEDDRVASGIIFNNQELLFGSVHNISSTGRFAFIEGRDGRRWFFHRNFLKDPACWEEIVAGSKVKFALGQNDRGPCAIDVELVDRDA